MQAELGQSLKLLLNRKLHVMTGDALVIRNGFIIDQRAISKVGGGDHHAPRTLSVGRAGHVVSRGGA